MYNQITALPPNFMACKNLRYLNLRSNLLQEFPPAVFSSINFTLDTLTSGTDLSIVIPRNTGSESKQAQTYSNRSWRFVVFEGMS